MVTNKVNDIFLRFSQAISYILHPLLTTLYIAIIVLFGDTYLNSSNISLKFKLVLLSYIALMTVVVPLISFYLLYLFKFVSNFKLPTRSDRIFPLLIVAICYLICMFICDGLIGHLFARKLFFTIALLVSIANIITFYFKMSFHAVGAATALAFIIGFNYIGYGDMESEIALIVVLSGLLSTCRLYLEKHTITEIALSYAYGLFFTLLLLWI